LLREKNEGQQIHGIYLLFAGGTAGSLAWFCSYPLDVVKTRLQTQPDIFPPKYSGIIDCAIQIYKEESGGLRGFSKGLFVTILRSFPVNAAIFFVYEYMAKLLR